MEKVKKSFAAMLMYYVIGSCLIFSGVCFALYYIEIYKNSTILWLGIVAFMIMYHLWMRIICGNITKLFKISYNNFWFREKPFEKNLYKVLKVKSWKDKVLTYNPQLFSVKKYSLDEIALTMTKAELDHWINQLVSLSSLLFAFLWGQFYIFLITAFLAMVFDGQFILIQRYNRPRVLNIIERRKGRLKKNEYSCNL